MNDSGEKFLHKILDLLAIGQDYMSWESPDLPARFLSVVSNLISNDGIMLLAHSDDSQIPRLAAYSGFSRDEVLDIEPYIARHIRSSAIYPFEFRHGTYRLICEPFFRGHYLEGAIAFARRTDSDDGYSPETHSLLKNLGLIGTGIFHAASSISRLRHDVQTRDYLMSRLYILYEASNALVRSQDIDVRLHVILTATTLGEGLGFNRAVLYLLDPSDGALKGRMGVGPSSVSEARSTWDRMQRAHTPGYEILREIVKTHRMPDEALNSQLLIHRISSDDPGIMMRTVVEKRAFLIERSESGSTVSENDRFILESDSFATVPLILADRAIGLIAVDNRFNQKRISPEDLQFLWMISNLASASIDSSNNYERIVRLNKELRHTREALIKAEKASAVGELALYLAHEIRNPLVAAGGFAGKLLGILKEGAPEHTYAGIIRTETLRMERILSDVLKTTKLPHSQPSLCDLHALVNEVISLLSFSTEERGIEVRCHYTEHTAMIYADPVLLRQALHNIVSNSIQAQPNGGMIEFRTQIDPESIHLSISDAGPGVDPSRLTEIFKPFYTTKSDGTGLGLFLTKRIINSFNAQITPLLPDTGGLRFVISFPEGQEREE